MPFTNEHRQKLSESIKKSWTPERKQKYSEARKGAGNPFFGKHHTNRPDLSGERNPFFGKSHTAEAVAAISKSKMGRCSKLYKYGVTDADYKREIEAGNLWCFYHKGFVSASEFARPSLCRSCQPRFDRERALQLRFGVTLEWFDTKLAEQGGGCAICGSTLPFRGKNHLSIDHCHVSKKTRGILCARCNSILGYVEKPGWLDAALAYLEKYKCPSP